MTAVSTAPIAAATIPLPPFDPGLRSLDLALTPGRAVELLAGSLLRPGWELTACRPSYLRYKPGQSCLVQYRLGLRSDDGQAFDRLVHARLYARGRAERIWSRGRIQALAGRLDPDPVLRPAAYVRELGAVVQAYPLDLDLPPLARLGSLSLVRYKPARKAVLRDGDERLYAKIYADDRGARSFEVGRALHAAGVPVIEPLRYSRRLRVLVHHAAAGEPLRSLYGSDEYESVLGEAGQALRLLHSARPHSLPLHDWRADLAAAAWAVGVAFPKLGRTSKRLADRLTAALRAQDTKTVAAHGDFYDDQLLISPDGVLILDLDRAVLADPALDLGTFLAHVALRGDGDRARDSLLSGYGRPPDRRAIALAEAGALLKLAVDPFRRLDPNWPEEVEQRLLVADEKLAEAMPARRPRRDGALPHLEELLDHGAAGRVLAGLYRESVEVLGIGIVRHRPGRRCTLRYDLSIAERRERVYAKTYASRRAPRVHAALAAFARAHSLGSPLSVPEPVGCVPRLHLVVQREVVGEPATSRLLAGDDGLARRIAAALHALHASPVELEATHDPDDEVTILSGRLLELPPSLRPGARECLLAIADALEGFGWRQRPAHRDLYDEQVIVGGGRLAFLDLDDAAFSEPAVDVANFLAHLQLLALDEPRAVAALDAVMAGFLSQYRALDPELDPALVCVLRASTLLRLACIHWPRGGDRLADRLIASSWALVDAAR